jgi:lipid-binding SYLF domain-containing protein
MKLESLPAWIADPPGSREDDDDDTSQVARLRGGLLKGQFGASAHTHQGASTMTAALRLAFIIPVLLPALLLGASTADARRNKDKGEIAELVQQVKKDWQAKDKTFNKTLKKAYAYAIFPEVGKGGFIIGASHGAGEVYKKGKLIGHVKMTQTTVGAQVGGQTYAEVILFKNKAALDRFKANRFEGTAAATAIGGKKGAAAASKYKDGVAIMVLPKKGVMAEAAGGGQKFAFEPVGK